jgi:hypothetical protein
MEMKITACAVVFLMFLASSISAQFVSPVPVFETEVRDKSSIKLRSIELARIKREAGKTPSDNPGPAGVNHFLEIKEDFEKIQLLENDIVKVYTTGKQIEYTRIAAFSAEINKSASRLKENLFSLPNKVPKNLPDEPEIKEKTLPNGVKDLIVELDNTIGAFVSNPIFLSSKKAKPKEIEKAETDLAQVIRLSIALQQEAEKQPKN